jgi:hypothetical protein
VPIVDTHTAIRKAQMADFDGAIELCRATLDNLVASGDGCWRALATTTLVESLLRRGADGDVAEAQAAIDRLAAVPTDPAYVMHEVPLLRMRALLARAHGDEDGYRDSRIGIGRRPPTWVSKATSRRLRRCYNDGNGVRDVRDRTTGERKVLRRALLATRLVEQAR